LDTSAAGLVDVEAVWIWVNGGLVQLRAANVGILPALIMRLPAEIL